MIAGRSMLHIGGGRKAFAFRRSFPGRGQGQAKFSSSRRRAVLKSQSIRCMARPMAPTTPSLQFMNLGPFPERCRGWRRESEGDAPDRPPSRTPIRGRRRLVPENRRYHAVPQGDMAGKSSHRWFGLPPTPSARYLPMGLRVFPFDAVPNVPKRFRRLFPKVLYGGIPKSDRCRHFCLPGMQRQAPGGDRIRYVPGIRRYGPVPVGMALRIPALHATEIRKWSFGDMG